MVATTSTVVSNKEAGKQFAKAIAREKQAWAQKDQHEWLRAIHGEYSRLMDVARKLNNHSLFRAVETRFRNVHCDMCSLMMD